VPIVNGYCTLAEFTEWQPVGIVKTARIEDVITATSRAIDHYCDRHFYQVGTVGVPVARTFVPCSSWRVDFGHLGDLTTGSVPVVATDAAGDGTYETTWAVSDYQLVPFSRVSGWPYTGIEAIGGQRFPWTMGSGRRDRLKITGVWGWDAVPADIKQACLIKAAKLFTRHQSPGGVAGVGDFGPIRISRFEDPDVVDLLNPYRRVAVLVA
jgi:hypothetical protein